MAGSRSALATPAGTFLNVPARSDICFDDARGLLYITSGGSILRYDVTSGTFLAPIPIGDSLGAMDISPDGSTLAVADASYGGKLSWFAPNPNDDNLNRIYLVNLASGDYKPIDFSDQGFNEVGVWTLAWDAYGKLLLSSQTVGLQGMLLRRYDPDTGQVDIYGQLRSDTALSPSGDRQTIAFAEPNASTGGDGIYHASNGGWLQAGPGTSFFNYDVAANRNGTQYAVPADSLRILGPDMNPIASFGKPAGAKYSPNSDVLYVPIAGSTVVNAYDTNSLALLRSYDTSRTFPTYDWTWTLADSFVWPRMAISADGRFLAVTVSGGVECFLEDTSFPDTTPPTTWPHTSPTPTDSGWNNTPVLMSLDATDGPLGSGVARTDYLLDGVKCSFASAFTVSGEGIHTVDYRSADASGNLEATKTVPVKIDTTAPSITPSPTGALNQHGWHRSPVTVHFSASDALSGLASVTPDVVLSSDGASQSVLGTATDFAGNSATTIAADINIDTTAPSITASATSPTNKYGWYRSPVTVHFSGADALSGLATITPDVTVSSEGASQMAAGVASDVAGNSATVQLDVNIDTEPPSTSDDHAPRYSSLPMIHLTAIDALSGVDSTSWILDGIPGTGTAVVVKLEGVHSLTYWSVDKAGNRESAHSVSFSVIRPRVGTTLFVSGASSVRKNRRYRLSGSIWPASAGGTVKVTFMRLIGKRWSRAGQIRETLSGGRFSCLFTPKQRGSWRAVVNYDGQTVASAVFQPSSATRRWRVR